jgi:hypothetical protein
MLESTPKFEHISLAELKAKLPPEERCKLDEEKNVEDDPRNGSGRRGPKNQPEKDGHKRKCTSRKSG